MAMSKKHYIAIAEIMRSEANEYTAHQYTIAQICAALCDYFEKDNPLFDRARFADAVFPISEED
jgi:hypothetical protein